MNAVLHLYWFGHGEAWNSRKFGGEGPCGGRRLVEDGDSVGKGDLECGRTEMVEVDSKF